MKELVLPILIVVIFLFVFAMRSVKRNRSRCASDCRFYEVALESRNAMLEHSEARREKLFLAAEHDLRQPAQSIVDTTENLKAAMLKLGATSNAELDNIQTAVAVFQDGLRSLHETFAGPRSGSKPIIESFDLISIVTKIASIFDPLARSRGLELKFPVKGIFIRSDRELLFSMISNLVSNALKNTDAGKVWIDYTSVNFGELCIRVSDTGRGIPAHRLSEIFDEYSRIDAAGRQGAGLGLSIVKRHARMLNHALRVESTLGVGSVFSICVPLGAQRERHPSGYDRSDAFFAGVVLLVEDDEAILHTTRRLMQDWGARVIAASSCEEATKLARGTTVDLIVSDHHFQRESTGLDLILDVRSRALRRIPALLITGDLGPGLERDAAYHGISLVYKPVHPLRLRVEMCRLLKPHGLSVAAIDTAVDTTASAAPQPR